MRLMLSLGLAQPTNNTGEKCEYIVDLLGKVGQGDVYQRFGVEGFGFRFGFRVQDLRHRLDSRRLKASDLGFGIKGLGLWFRVWSSEFRVEGWMWRV